MKHTTENTIFSKKALGVSLWGKVEWLEKKYGFKSYDGWNQVNGKGEEINRAYGEYNCLFKLINEYHLTS